MKKVLLTGGAGYIGSVLTRLLLERGYHVRVVDYLAFGGDSLTELLNNKNFEFIKADVRDAAAMKKALQGMDAVAHLAAIVGDPACSKQPDLAKSINEEGTKALYDLANQAGVKQFIFASTCSNYGKMSDPNSFCEETSPLAPVSLYAETKVAVEKYLLSRDKSSTCKPTCLRFATVYGISPRVRFDLTVNEFAKDAALNREITIFGEQFWRPYCHVIDLSRSVIAVLEAQEAKVAFNVFNVGDTNENYQKKMIMDEIMKILPDTKCKYVKKVEDPRDYRVQFSKIQSQLDFKISMRVKDGIEQIVRAIRSGLISNPDDSKYGNT